MCTFLHPEDQGPEWPPDDAPPVAEWHQVVTCVARTHRMGLGMPHREPGLESDRPEEEAVIADKLNHLRLMERLHPVWVRRE